jgi:hypothetical protein
MQLDVILRTHDGSSLHDWNQRIIDAPKAEIIRRCVISLVKALEPVEHTLTIFDDHSSTPTVEFLWDHGEVVVTGPGNNKSLLDALQQAGASRANLVYMVEDDYLHEPEAIIEMMDFFEDAREWGMASALHPYDARTNYGSHAPIRDCKVVTGSTRHWRTNTYCTGTVMAEPWVFREPEWEALAMHCDKPGMHIHEGVTTSEIWANRVHLFTPLPSLAIHLNENIPPLVDFQQLWEQNTLEKNHVRPRLRAS